MGTMLYAKGIFLNRSFDELNLTQPDLVAEVHQAYVRAGADVIETNTFGANRVKLGAVRPGRSGARDQRRRGRRSRGTRRASRRIVAGAIGPLGIRIEPWGKTGVDEAEAYFREQARGAARRRRRPLRPRDVPRRERDRRRDPRRAQPVATCRSSRRSRPRKTATRSTARRPRAFVPAARSARRRRRRRELQRRSGRRCSRRSSAWRASRTVPLSAQPNAGRPREIEGRNIYLCSPEYMASYARRFINNGVRLVGGCCGTTPEHIRQIKPAVRALTRGGAPRRQPRRGAERRPRRPRRRVDARRADRRSRGWRTRSRGGEFVVSVELVPPRGHRRRRARRAGAPAAHSRRRPRQHSRRSARERADERAGGVASLVQQQAGIETILHYACRDRNLLGMQSDLLGAHSMGIRNLLIITGDPPRVGDYPDATAVFDVDSIGLTNVVARLNRGLDIGGQPIGQPTAFHIGVAAESRRARSATRSCGGSNTRSRRARSSRSRSRCSTRPASRSSCERIGGVRHPDPRRRHAAREPAARRVHGQRGAGRARAGRRSSSGCAGPRTPGRAAGGRDADRARARGRDPPPGAGHADFDRRPERSRRPSQVMDADTV